MEVVVFLKSRSDFKNTTTKHHRRMVIMHGPKKPSFIDPTAFLTGTITIGEQDYIGPYAQVEAGNTFSVELANEVNLQDNVHISATTHDIAIGDRTSIAHGARVIDSSVGSFVFVGFNAYLENAVLDDGVMIQHGAKVIGVTIPKDRLVPPGAVITSAAQASQLLTVSEAHDHFKEEVVSVNNELAAGYAQMVLEFGKISVIGVGPNPLTTWTPQQTSPEVAKGVSLSNAVRVIGSVKLARKCTVGRKTSIRGDEGIPIIIGSGAKIGCQVTFHALKEQAIRIGNNLSTGDRVVFHGDLSIGDQVSVGSDAVLFKAIIGSLVTIGAGAIVIGVSLADGAFVPAGALVLDQVMADRLSPAVAVVFPVKIPVAHT
jgi:carbon dioxide concentrating mechanism protein CcmM